MRTTYRRYSRRQGFTLIEILIVILILSILMSVALPLYLAAVSDSQRKTCRGNMHTIANAEQAYRLQSAGHVYTTDMSDLAPELGAVPRCPAYMGTDCAYSLAIRSDGTVAISCKWNGGGNAGLAHGTFVPGLDHE